MESGGTWIADRVRKDAACPRMVNEWESWQRPKSARNFVFQNNDTEMPSFTDFPA